MELDNVLASLKTFVTSKHPILILLGPTGTGKSYLCENLKRDAELLVCSVYLLGHPDISVSTLTHLMISLFAIPMTLDGFSNEAALDMAMLKLNESATPSLLIIDDAEVIQQEALEAIYARVGKQVEESFKLRLILAGEDVLLEKLAPVIAQHEMYVTPEIVDFYKQSMTDGIVSMKQAKELADVEQDDAEEVAIDEADCVVEDAADEGTDDCTETDELEAEPGCDELGDGEVSGAPAVHAEPTDWHDVVEADAGIDKEPAGDVHAIAPAHAASCETVKEQPRRKRWFAWVLLVLVLVVLAYFKDAFFVSHQTVELKLPTPVEQRSATVSPVKPKFVEQQPLVEKPASTQSAQNHRVKTLKHTTEARSVVKNVATLPAKKAPVKADAPLLAKSGGIEAVTSVHPAANKPMRYTLQLVGSHHLSGIHAFMQRYHLDEGTVSVKTVHYDHGDWYELTMGQYETLQEAKQAVAALPEALQAKHVWIRRMLL